MAKRADEHPERLSIQESRIGKRVVSAYFDPAAAKAIKGLALDLDTSLQGLMAVAFNDLLEKYGRGRPAAQPELPTVASLQKNG